MSRWWRAYDESVDDPKLQQLAPELFKAWFNICCITSQNGGTLPPIKDVAFKLRTTEAKAEKVIGALRDAVLIDDDEAGSRPHNWNARQYKSDVTDPTNAERQQRYRDRHRVTESNGVKTVTPPVTVKLPDTDSETERKKDAADAAPIDPDADLFRRGKEVLGKDAGSLIAKLKKAKGSIPHARAVIEQASTKENPREYVGRVLNGAAQSDTSFRDNPTGGSLI